jgi:hypothetical protein
MTQLIYFTPDHLIETTPTPWLLLIHQVPTSPPYLRVKIWRRLQKIGAVAVKGSVYALPRSDDAIEDFHWVAREIMEAGGEASICEATFVEGITNDELIALFCKAREADYHEVLQETDAIERELREPKPGYEANSAVVTRVSRLRLQLTGIKKVDFFSSPAGTQAEARVFSLEARIRHAPIRKTRERAGEYRRRTWVTRKGIHVDRIASAWLIRRFIDKEAQFKFVAARGYRPEAGELRFDMFDAEFTHADDLCTFEVLISRMHLKDRALTPIAEMIHDIDLKETKFDHPETAGLALMINSVCAAHKEDAARLDRGAAILDDIYGFYKRR